MASGNKYEWRKLNKDFLTLVRFYSGLSAFIFVNEGMNADHSTVFNSLVLSLHSWGLDDLHGFFEITIVF